MCQEKSCILLWNHKLNSPVCMACKNLFFRREKNAVYEGSCRGVSRAKANP